MDESEGSQPSDTMRERVGGSRLKLWVLMDANRWVLAGVMLVGFFLALVVLGVADPSPLQRSVATSDPLETVFQAFITAIVTGVTLVVTFNQLVLSQEQGPLGDQRDRMQGAMAFREDVEAVVEPATSPADPASFLSVLVDAVRSRANALVETVDGTDEPFANQVEDYADSLTANATQVGQRLDGARFGSFDVLGAALDFNYSWKIYEARRLKNEHASDMAAETRSAFDDLVETLTFFGPAREHFKTLYFQWELINLSRAMLYSALPALLVAVSMVMYVDARAVPGDTFGVSNDVLVASFGVTASVLPFSMLLSYVLRIATVAKRTLSIGPFILRETSRSDDVDWE